MMATINAAVGVRNLHLRKDPLTDNSSFRTEKANVVLEGTHEA